MPEVKLVHGPVEDSIESLSQAIQALDSTIKNDVKGDNVLNVADKLEELNRLLQDVLKIYQELSIENVDAVRKSVDALKETEKQVALAIQLLM